MSWRDRLEANAAALCPAYLDLDSPFQLGKNGGTGTSRAGPAIPAQSQLAKTLRPEALSLPETILVI
jgi:hypothetical protein